MRNQTVMCLTGSSAEKHIELQCVDTVVIFALVRIKDDTYDHVTASRIKSGNLLIIIINII